jgi:hypothetical protein
MDKKIILAWIGLVIGTIGLVLCLYKIVEHNVKLLSL